LTDHEVHQLAKISKSLRKEREQSFYGDEEMLPSESYGSEESSKALQEVTIVLALTKKVFS
jgi:hypothetical protein